MILNLHIDVGLMEIKRTTFHPYTCIIKVACNGYYATNQVTTSAISINLGKIK